MLTFGSLFAGIGGFDLGLERAGMRCMWQVEIDDYCSRVLAKHWPDVERHRDVRECGGHNLETVDVICGGFPCQPFSYTGREKGVADTRWLWPQFARVVTELQPKYVVVENVPGLLHHGMGLLLADLAALGYDAEWDCIPARTFGAWHNRDRAFVIAYADDTGSCGGGKSKQWRECEEMERREQHRGYGGDRIMAGTIESLPTWATEPRISRVADGVPRRVDRLRAIGNAVVPQVAEWIGQRICDVDMSRIPLCTCAVLGGAPLIRDSSRLGHRYGGGCTTSQEEE